MKRHGGTRGLKSHEQAQDGEAHSSIIDFTAAHEKVAESMLGPTERQLGRDQESAASSKPASNPKSAKDGLLQAKELERALTKCVQGGNIFGQELQRLLSQFISTNMPQTPSAEKRRKRGRPRKNRSAQPGQRHVTCSIQVAIQ